MIDANVHTHTYELHSDVTRTHTHEGEVYAGPIRKYTQVDVGGDVRL